jgi:predicted O-linked N-acetylglucosamine transferase (SPINDLY family)
LDLIHLGSKHVDDLLDREPFTQVKYVDLSKDGFNYKEVADNDYAAVYYPDIGMNNESIWLSNMRLAPVQIMGLGHPVSTFGSKVDYIITGAAVEHPDHVQNNYSERVVLIPGLGVTPVDPQYTQKYAEKADPEFIINCCWTAPKLNYPMLKVLVEIKKQASKQVVYHFLPSWTIGRQNAAITFLRDMHALFGKDLLVTAEKPYHDYLESMESGHLSLVPHPFGGCNTVVDSFAVGLPCVALEGDKWYNRCAPGLLRQCGFDDLITHSIKDYIAKTVEIIDNDSYRLELIGRLSLVDLQKTLYSTEEPEHFADAFDYLLKNHEQLQAENHRNPIRIGC